MKRTAPAFLVSAAFLILYPLAAAAQVFYQYPDAAPIKAGQFVVGPYFSVGDDALFRVGGLGRMNATRYMDVGFEFLFDSSDGDERWGLGGDLKFAFFPETNAIPFDLSLVVGGGLIDGKESQILQFPVGGIISSPYKLDSGNLLTPYLGVYLLYVHSKLDPGDLPTITDTDLDVELRAGLRYTLTDGPDLFVAGHLGRDEMVMVGACFWLKR